MLKKTKMANASLTLFLSLSLFLFSSPSVAVDFIISSQNLTHGATLISAKRIFELGFFSPGNSTNRYLGIWYKIIPVRTIVWVANRENPVTNSSAAVVLKINTTTSDLLLFENDAVVWVGKSLKPVKTPKLHLLDNGNLVLKDAESEKISWQSFDYPTDTLLPGMKLGWDFENRIQRRLSAWKSSDDPSPGSLTMEMMNTNYPEPAMWNGSKEFMRSGPWNGLQFSAKPTSALPILVYSYVNNKSELTYSYELINSSLIGRMVLNQTLFRREALLWSASENIWKLYATMPRDYCDTYGLCGAFGSCDIEQVPACQCLRGFHPKVQEKWNLMDYTEGCVRKKALNCSDKTGFAKLPGLKLPDTKQSWVNESMGLNECRDKCLRNCSCVAFANTDIRGSGSGCAIWFGDLVDIKVVRKGGQDLYVRMLASELGDFVSFMCVCVSLMCRDKEDEFRCRRRYRRSGDSGDCWSGFDWVLPY
ncbi:unnamed protein product [Citrullus colocynthis]|uniref:S-locus glycoprotein n=1 Tax=Citrullus colocynthis TaxID=252529 RepID=A0ABP0YB80_9ROSI